MKQHLLTVIIFFVLPLISFSQDGTLDNSFGVNGKVVTNFNGLNSDAYSILQQQDGKLIATGTYYSSDNSDNGIA